MTMSATRVLFIVATLFSAIASVPSQAASVSCAQFGGQFSGSIGFVILRDSNALIRADEVPESLGARTKASSFVACVAVDLTRQPRVGAINVRLQVYNSGATDSPSAAVEYDGPRQYSSQVRQFGATPSSYATVNIDAYQKYHGCNDPKNPSYIKYTNYDLSANFHVSVDSQRTDATPQQRLKFLFSRDVPPSCGFGGAVEQFIGYFGANPAFGAFANRLDSTIKSRRSILRRYDFRNSSANQSYVTYNLPGIAVGQCLRVEASHVFDQSGNSSALIGHACR
jgi:hypothetical protein